jgi:tetratricopeptide (TPR) repeat protein
MTNRPIDGRSKLLKALQLAPKDYRPHMWLGRYYLSEVGHFQLAYRYLLTAEKLFEEQFGTDSNNSLQQSAWREHASLLYLRSEAELNLDMYARALESLDRFAKRYWDDWYPGARAWILMKLKRVDEAIAVAQGGLLRGAEPGRTYNILGILLSLKGSRELALDSFSMAIKSELLLGGSGQVATPLNNAGEVYRELFQDEMAEASWVQAVQLPDGCEHILPSLNLAIMYIDQLRLFQAERVLDDFQACFANHSTREDTEHRALLALARGRIALHKGDIDTALQLLNQSMERQQWFGKIGTNENDVRFASTIAMAQALDAKATVLEEQESAGLASWATAKVERPWMRMRSWWLNRRAREIALEELDDFDDLYIRNTDTMLEYPTLGSVIAGFPTHSIRSRISRQMQADERKPAHTYYRLFLGQNELAQGDTVQALKTFEEISTQFRPIDRLANAELLTDRLIAEQQNQSILFSPTVEYRSQMIALRNELFRLLPSQLRYHDIALPIVLVRKGSKEEADLVDEIADALLALRFDDVEADVADSIGYTLTVSAQPQDETGTSAVSLTLSDRKTERQIAKSDGRIGQDGKEIAELVNGFIVKAFSHQIDPSGQILPKLKILEGSS